MATYADLTDQQKSELARLLNNLNLGLAKAHFGDIFTSYLAGNKPTLTDAELENLRRLLNNLNLGTYHQRFGDIVTDLFAGTAVDLTDADQYEIARALEKLNLGLAKFDFADIAVAGISVPLVQYELAPVASTKGKYTSSGVNSATLELVEKEVFAAVFQEKGNTASGDGATLAGTGDAAVATAAWDAATHKVTITGVAAGNSVVTILNQDGNVTFTLNVKIKVKPPVITAKAAPTDFRVSGTDLDLASLFTVVPAGTALTYKTDGNSKAKIDTTKTKLQAVAAGDVKVTASAPDAVDATVTINVKPANGVVAKSPNALEMEIGEGFTMADLFTVTGPVTPTYSVNNGNATIDAGKIVVTGAVAGDAVLTATVGSVTATVPLKIKAAQTVAGFVGRGDIHGKKVGDVIPVADLYLNVAGGNAGTAISPILGITPAGAVTYDKTAHTFTVAASAAGKDVVLDAQKELSPTVKYVGHVILKNVSA